MQVETLPTRVDEETRDGSFFLIGMLSSAFSGFLVGVGLTLACMKLFF